jgi:membrane-anchored protein YejM (alkaline phosphatase superfamily)
MTLQQTIQAQVQAWSMGGPQNGLVSLTNIRNALADAAMLGGLHNPDRYYQPMSPEREAQLMQQAAQAAQGQQQSDPNQAYMQVEMAKVQQKAQADVQKAQITAQKAQADVAIDAQRLRMQDDLERDKMAQDLAIKVAEILGKHSVQVNTAAVQAQQAAPRV